MAAREICDGIFSIGVSDWERTAAEELLEIPYGTTYNSYIVCGNTHNALIDTVDLGFDEELITNIVKSKIESLDYIIINHTEQDHTAILPTLLELFQTVKVLTSEKGKELLKSLHHIPDFRITAVKDGETLDLGGKTLEFHMAPMCHWPDTMMTYVREDRVLFSSDLFGSHYAAPDLFVRDKAQYEVFAKRYFGLIMMPFAPMVRKALETAESLNPAVIAPAHGPLHDDASFIFGLYDKWTDGHVENKVIIPYITMHGTTKKMVSLLTESLVERGISVRPFDLASADTGSIVSELIDTPTVVIASPTVLGGPHPKAAYAAMLLNVIKANVKHIGIIGSFGWAGMSVQKLTDAVSSTGAEMLPPVYITGAPDEKESLALDELAEAVAQRHKALFEN